MPPAKFGAYVKMLPRLLAEETLRLLQITVAAQNREMGDRDWQRWRDQVQRTAAGAGERVAAISPAVLAEMGIRMQTHNLDEQKGGDE